MNDQWRSEGYALAFQRLDLRLVGLDTSGGFLMVLPHLLLQVIQPGISLLQRNLDSFQLRSLMLVQGLHKAVCLARCSNLAIKDYTALQYS